MYLTVYGRALANAGIIKFVGDTMSFIPPLCLSGAVKYVTDYYYDDIPDLPVSDGTWVEYDNTEWLYNAQLVHDSI